MLLKMKPEFKQFKGPLPKLPEHTLRSTEGDKTFLHFPGKHIAIMSTIQNPGWMSDANFLTRYIHVLLLPFVPISEMKSD